jgi:hypothetical protein
MKPGTKLGLILGGSILVLGFVLIIATVGFTLLSMSVGTEHERELYKKRTAETEGIITNVSFKTSYKEYTYKYVVNGVSYSASYSGSSSRVENKKDVGKKGLVCYDPSDPSSSAFYHFEFMKQGERKKCGGS